MLSELYPAARSPEHATLASNIMGFEITKYWRKRKKSEMGTSKVTYQPKPNLLGSSPSSFISQDTFGGFVRK